MKQRFISVLVFSFLFFSMTAQVEIEEYPMSKGRHTAFTIEISETNSKFVEVLWKKHLKGYGGKSKKGRNSAELVTENAKINAIDRGGVILFSIFDQRGDDVVLTMWVDMGDEFLSKKNKNSQVQGAVDLLEEFAKAVRTEILRLQIKDETSTLGKLEKDLKKLERDNLRYEREIQIAEEKILKNKTRIEENLSTQEDMRQNIDIQRTVLDSIKAIRFD